MARKFFFLIHIILIILTIITFGVIYIAPSKQSYLLGSTLFIPGLLMLNFLFLIFWMLKLDKRILVGLIFIICFFSFYNRFFAISSVNAENNDEGNKIKLATYNVLHYYNQKFDKDSSNNCFSLFDRNKVDVIGLQEANINKKVLPYTQTNYTKNQLSQSWIYTKHKLIDSQLLDISYGLHTKRKGITCADIVIDSDTLRVYNLHLESYRFSKEVEKLNKTKVGVFKSRITKVFKIHEREVNKLIKHINTSPYPVVVMGDFNNNAYSYEYTQLIKQCNLKDTFVEAANGFGATYQFKYFPLRIDFILVPATAKVISHEVIQKKNWSDHYPIITEISL